MEGATQQMRSLALTPTWSVASVLTIFVLVSLIVERSINRLSLWLKKTNRNPLFEALEKMKEELMLLGFISLLLTASSRIISNICIDSKFYSTRFYPCSPSQIEDTEEPESNMTHGGRRLMISVLHKSARSIIEDLNHINCKEGHEPFLSYEGLEQLHRFIFIMAITHVSYSCLTMLLALIKIHTWRKWEEEALRDRYDCLVEVTKALTLTRQSAFIRLRSSNKCSRALLWVICFFRQFGSSVVRADYLTLRMGFIMNHNLTSKYDFHSYMIRSMEEEFKTIVGVSAPLWGVVIAFMLFNIHDNMPNLAAYLIFFNTGSNLYFWVAIIPISLVLIIGAKLQCIIAILGLESVGINQVLSRVEINPRNSLFWFKKPELLLFLVHFVLFQNAFELASFFWFWWQFGYDSCFIGSHSLVYTRLILGLIGQFLCSYSTLPLYALVTQMGSNYKAALIPRRIRESIHGWRKDVRRRRRHSKHRCSIDDTTTVHTETSTVCSLEDEQQLEGDSCDDTTQPSSFNDTLIAFEQTSYVKENYNSSSEALLPHPASVPSSPPSISELRQISRSISMPAWSS